MIVKGLIFNKKEKKKGNKEDISIFLFIYAFISIYYPLDVFFSLTACLRKTDAPKGDSVNVY